MKRHAVGVRARLGAWYLNRRSVRSAVLLAVTAAAVVLLGTPGLTAKRMLTNPQVPQGGSNSFTSTGTQSPATGLTWDILNSSQTTVATSSVPNGWTVSMSSSTFTVGAPSTATIATGYKVRYGAGSQPPIDSLPLDAQIPPPPTSQSALFDVVASVPAPPAPIDMTANAAASFRVELHWSVPTDRLSEVTGFKIERKVGVNGTYTQIESLAANDVLIFQDNGCDPESTYYYRVRSYGPGGNSAYSAEVSATTYQAIVITPDPSYRSVALTWTGNYPNACYGIWRSDSASGPFKLVGETTNHTFTDTPLRNDVPYYYRVEDEPEVSAVVSATPNSKKPHFEVVKLEESKANSNLTATIVVVNAQSGTNTTGPDGNGVYIEVARNYYLCYDENYANVIAGATTRISPGEPYLGKHITSGHEYATMTVPATGGTARVLLYKQESTIYYHYVNGVRENIPGGTSFTGFVQEDVCNYCKATCTTVPIDSRLCYGQPDKEGVLTADPNADLRSVNFNGWTYKGGLFVGNAPDSSGDMSGAGRTQIYVNVPPNLTDVVWSTVTLYYTGYLSAFTGNPPIALSMAEDGAPDDAFNDPDPDPFLNTPPAEVTWAKRWDLSQADYVSSLSIPTTTTPNEFVSFQIWNWSNVGKLVIHLKDEAGAVSSHLGCWRYFASPAYAEIVGAYAAPKVWIVNRTTHTGEE